MPFISRRAHNETLALIDRLRDRVTELQDDLRQVTDGDVRLARHAGTADAALTVECAALRATHAAVLERAKRLESQVDALRKDRDQLRSQLDDALGYTGDNPLYVAVDSR